MTKPRPPAHRKRYDVNQQQGNLGQDLVTEKLPTHWIKRPITPDYGLDLHIEVFDQVEGNFQDAETRGEHFYIQAKSVLHAEVTKHKIRSRGNVAKVAPDPKSGTRYEIPVIAFDLEVGELMTIEAMGNAVPALLCIADMSTRTVYYLCLNDYIAKVLLPNKFAYTEQQTVTIHVPTWNVLDSHDSSFTYIQLLARRPKYYSAFNTFMYQYTEFEKYTTMMKAVRIDTNTDKAKIDPDIISMLEVFLSSNLRLDVFQPAGVGYWLPLKDLGERFTNLQATLSTLKEPVDEKTANTFMREVHMTMQMAADVGRLYEEVVREWRLPTVLSTLLDDDPAFEHRPTLTEL